MHDELKERNNKAHEIKEQNPMSGVKDVVTSLSRGRYEKQHSTRPRSETGCRRRATTEK
ncbi:423_t:CDS:2 [Rhizophagus irregularis]|nr:423_t:CDS:2 [Rhizophagus irregularis]